MFHPGQKVLCINNGPSRFGNKFSPPTLRKGAIYTVTHCWHHQINDTSAVLLAEASPTNGYAGFDATRFVPIKERPTSIEIFKKMLRPEKQDA